MSQEIKVLPDNLRQKFKKIIAKKYGDKEETLEEHNKKVQKVLESLIALFKEKHEIREDLLKIAVEFHDIGKAESSWLASKTKKNIHLIARHEVLSFCICKEYLEETNLENFEKLLVLLSILLHHHKYFGVDKSVEIKTQDEDEFDHLTEVSTMLYSTSGSPRLEWLNDLSQENRFFADIAEKFNRFDNKYLLSVIQKTVKELSEGLTKEESFELLYHRALLCAADQLASANYDEKKVEELFKIDYELGEDSKQCKLREDQEYIVNCFDEETSILIMDRRPGAGKTLIAECIAKKLNRSLIHGTPKNIISDDLASKSLTRLYNSDFEEPEEWDERDASFKEIRNKHQWFFGKSCRLYTTPDNLFLTSQCYKRHFLLLRAIYNGLIVLDEFHDCVVDEYRRINLFEMMEKFLYFNIPLVLMSGTTPLSFVEKVKKLCEQKEKKYQFVSDASGELIHCENGEQRNCDVQLKQTCRGKISFWKDDPSSDLVTDFQWWDKSLFTKGYFEGVSKLLEKYIEKKESVAVCFLSKKSIFHFVHLFSEKYKLGKDYAVICSPRMTDKSYRGTIHSALGQFKKGTKAEDRTLKFLLCTSYTEMGVDFSVQHMILEVSFLHHVDQNLGRLNRWKEYGQDASCVIFPAFTRFTAKEAEYRRYVYGSEENYDSLIDFYKKKDRIDYTNSWYSVEELKQHFAWLKIDSELPEWKFENTCGLYRTCSPSKEHTGINGMYRQINSIPISWNGEKYEVPRYRVDDSHQLKLTPHPELFI